MEDAGGMLWKLNSMSGTRHCPASTSFCDSHPQINSRSVFRADLSWLLSFLRPSVSVLDSVSPASFPVWMTLHSDFLFSFNNRPQHKPTPSTGDSVWS